MKIKPVKRSPKPEYPTEYYFINHPELLSNYLPKRWGQNKFVSSALSVFIIAGLNNCDKDRTKQKAEISWFSNFFNNLSKEQPSKKMAIAPIFVHGDGNGAIGCVAISPPVFISEDEALKIIMDEFQKEKLSIDTANCPNINFKADAIANDCLEENQKIPKAKISLSIDGVEKTHNFLVEYISAQDYSKYQTDDGCVSSAQSINTKKAAELFRDELIKQNTRNAVIFYDPMPRMDFENTSDFEKMHKDTKEQAKQQLIAQVQDFMNWLKKEEIIK